MTISAFRLTQHCRLPSEHAKLGVTAGRGVDNTAEGVDSDSDDEEVAVTCFRGLRVGDEFDSSDDDDNDESSVAADDENCESFTTTE